MNNRILLTGGRLLDPSEGLLYAEKDLLIENGRIAKIADHIPPQPDMQVLELAGKIVSPGFIDIHTHVFPGDNGLGVPPDRVGVETGVTCVIDAGTAGPANMGEFVEQVIRPAKTRVLSEMHFATHGLFVLPEANDPSKYDLDLAEEAYRRYAPYIVAIKARASHSTVGEMGITPIREAKKLASRLGLPLYVHIGNAPPSIDEVLDLMQKGDMITHSFHGKPGGLLQDGRLRPATQAARDRGVRFDVGHGEASFNFNTARTAFALGFFPDVISTDLHRRNVDGPVYSLPFTLDKMLALGISLEDCVRKVTSAPAEIFSIKDLGRLREGYLGDITVFHLEEGNYRFQDSDGNSLDGVQSVRTDCAIVEGVIQMQR